MNSPRPSQPPTQQPPGQSPPRTPTFAQPRLDPPPDILFRYHARVLDPTTAPLLPDQRPVQPTVYVADRLLVVREVSDDARKDLDTALVRNGLKVSGDPTLRRIRNASVDVIQLAPSDAANEPGPAGQPAPPPGPAPDAFRVLQTLRTINADSAAQVQLEHLVSAAQHTAGHPFVSEHIYDPLASYGVPGYGGRQPVSWVGPAPVRDKNFKARRPVVALLDTAIDLDHPWLADCMTPDSQPSRPSLDPPIANPLEGTLDSDAGHATFIAGLVHQHCPDANLLNMPIMGGDGLVVENELLDALQRLADRQVAAITAGDPDGLIDVVVLSLGYYHESITDGAADQPLLRVLRQLADAGVAVVCAAGNEATSRPLFPAAFADSAPVEAKGAKSVPITAVGALNPNASVAMFSNVGDWIRYQRPGVSVVSAHERINAALQPLVATGDRASIDPDDFTGGFAVWSGTSFAAPVLAGEIAQYLCGLDEVVLSGSASVESRSVVLAQRAVDAIASLATQSPLPYQPPVERS